jgi:hypothetical protein
VTNDVGERLLDDPVGGQLDRGGQRLRLTLDLQRGPQAAAARGLDQLRKVAQAGGRLARGLGLA